MAYVASLGSGNMRGTLAGGDGAVMAVLAHIRGLAVVQGHYIGLPAGTGRMAGFTQISANRMRCRLVGGIGAGVTACAIIHGLVMWKWRDQRHPYIRGMTAFTQFRSLRMAGSFAGNTAAQAVVTP